MIMNIRFVSQESEWTDAMRECVWQRIVEPLGRTLKHSDFELSVHLRRRKALEMWVVLQTFDGRHNEVVRSQGDEFHILVNEISSKMRAHLRRKPSPPRKGFFPNPFRFLPFERRSQRPA
jgi:ribosome-associated translation inhibitor RaiA